MTEKTKTIWKAISAVVVIILTAIGVYAALVQADILDNPRAAKTTTAPTVTQAGIGSTDPTNSAEPQLAVGDITHFGSYDWRVLDIDTVYNRALLLSEDIIEQRPYNTEFTDVTWETCTLRAYLNSSFYGSFNEGDRSRIALTRNINPDNTWGRTKGVAFGTPGGNPTDDYIFLLSVAEILKHFPGLRLYKDSDGDEWYYEADERLVSKFNNSGSWWWLRSPGYYQDYAAGVDNDGYVYLSGNNVNYETGGVRPALWLNL